MRGRRGFSLIELTLCLGVMTILLGAIAGTIGLAARAVPAKATDGSATSVAGPLNDLLAEASLATQIFAADGTSISFAVADRDKDGVEETIEYSWAGAGTPLLRKVNAGAATEVSPALGRFQLALTTEGVSESAPGAAVDGAEQLLGSYTGPTTGTYSISTGLWAAQYFRPLLPADATAYSITRVRVFCRRGSLGSSTWAIHKDSGSGTPAPLAVQSQSVTSAALATSDNWYQVTFSTVTNVLPTEGLWLVLSQTLGSSCTVTAALSGVPSRREGVATSTNLGVGWTTAPSASFKYEVYGLVRRPGTVSVLTTRGRVLTVAAVEDGGGDVCRRSAQLLSSPQTSLVAVPVDDEGLIGGVLDLLLGAP